MITNIVKIILFDLRRRERREREKNSKNVYVKIKSCMLIKDSKITIIYNFAKSLYIQDEVHVLQY